MEKAERPRLNVNLIRSFFLEPQPFSTQVGSEVLIATFLRSNGSLGAFLNLSE